jgi:hypothetical protein
MPLNFTKTNVTPGEPVTAQAWNAIVDGLFEVQALLSAGSGAVRVAITGDPRDIDAARVVATDAGGVRFAAVPPSHPGEAFVVPKLTAGAYTITVTAPSCTDVTAPVTVASDGSASPDPVTVALAFTGQRMPNVLGVKWKDAVGSLQAVNPHALDASGKGVPLAGFDTAYADVPVLMQWPDPGDIVPTGSVPHVILATIVKAAVLVPTPKLVGLTIAEAQAEAAKLGLVIKVV